MKVIVLDADTCILYSKVKHLRVAVVDEELPSEQTSVESFPRRQRREQGLRMFS